MKISIEELEKLRIKARNIVIIGLVISIIVTIILYLTIDTLSGIICIVITFFISAKSIKTFNLAFKNVFVKEALLKVFTDINYKPEMGLDKTIIANTEMMCMGDRYSSNDYLSAKYKGVQLQQADIHIEEERKEKDSEGNTYTYYVTLFQGKWMVFEFNKSFKSNIQVCEKGFYNRLFLNCKIRNWFKELKKVELEDIEFNKQFNSYAENEHDAFYVLTPPIIEALKSIGSNKNETLLLCFVNNQLHVGLHNNKDSFENSNVFKKINPAKIEKQLLEEITKITQFIDALNLNRDIFGKEVL